MGSTNLYLTPDQLRLAHKLALLEPKKPIQSTIKVIKASNENTVDKTKIKPLFTRALAERATGKITVFKKAFGSAYD